MTVTANPSPAGAPPVDLVTLTIDEIEVSVPKGTLVIRAAEELGIAIPRFCDHPLLAPAGACRQCLVEVSMPGPDGSLRPMPKPQAACTLEVGKGMVVATQLTSPVADKAQRGVMELLLINHPLDCPVCDKGGECPLQNQAMANGQATSRFTETKRTFPKPIRISTQVLLDRERCILCQRCTRFSKEIAGDPFIDLQMRGAHQQIGTFSPGILGYHVDLAEPEPAPGPPEVLEPTTVGDSLLDTSGQPFASYFSGNTVQICPVGALTGAAYRFRSRPFDLVSSAGVCEHCAGGCALRVDHRRGTVLRRLAAEDPAVNEEWNCDKGRWAFTWSTSPDRLTHPLVRDAESGELEPASWPYALQVAAAGLAAARDAGGVGVLPGGRLTVEDAYAYAKFARTVLATNDVDFRARPHSAEEEAFLGHLVAGRGLGVTYGDLERASSVLLVCLEPEDESAISFLRLRKAVLDHGLPVASVAPFAGRGLVKLSGALLPAAPGQEARVLGTAAARDALTGTAPVIMVGARAAESPGALTAVLALAAGTGARIAWVPRRAGERGGVEAGALPSLLPGGRPVADVTARVDTAAAWDVASLPEAPGRDTAGILAAAAAGSLAGLLVGGVDPGDLPDPVLAEQALAAAGFVVSLEVRASAVTPHADVVLPVAPPPEKSGTYLNWEGRWRPYGIALRPETAGGRALSDAEVLDALATEAVVPLGLPSPAAAYAELAEFGAWEGARAPAPDVPPAETVMPGWGEAVLATWSLLLDAGRLQDGEPYLAGTAHRPVARMSAATAAGVLNGAGAPAGSGTSSGNGRGAGDGAAARVRVSTGRGSVELPLVVTDMPDGVVWLPANSGASRVHATLGASSGATVSVGPASGDLTTADGSFVTSGELS